MRFSFSLLPRPSRNILSPRPSPNGDCRPSAFKASLRMSKFRLSRASRDREYDVRSLATSLSFPLPNPSRLTPFSSETPPSSPTPTFLYPRPKRSTRIGKKPSGELAFSSRLIPPSPASFLFRIPSSRKRAKRLKDCDGWEFTSFSSREINRRRQIVLLLKWGYPWRMCMLE